MQRRIKRDRRVVAVDDAQRRARIPQPAQMRREPREQLAADAATLESGIDIQKLDLATAVEYRIGRRAGGPDADDAAVDLRHQHERVPVVRRQLFIPLSAAIVFVENGVRVGRREIPIGLPPDLDMKIGDRLRIADRGGPDG